MKLEQKHKIKIQMSCSLEKKSKEKSPPNIRFFLKRRKKNTEPTLGPWKMGWKSIRKIIPKLMKTTQFC